MSGVGGAANTLNSGAMHDRRGKVPEQFPVPRETMISRHLSM
jgi:hypothetical protein